MKKKKLSLGELKVKSFVTEPGNLNEDTIKGGAFSYPNPCQIKTIVRGCGIVSVDCPILTLNCPSKFACPSVVDGCPSTPGPCTIDTRTIMTETINPGGGF